jgi:hypothetical protein
MATMIDMHTHEILFVNRHMKSIFGDVLGKRCWQVFQKDQDGPCPFCIDKHLLDEKGSPSGSYRQQIQNTLTQRWHDQTDSASITETGRLVKMSIAVDITEQWRPHRSPPQGGARPASERSDSGGFMVMCANCHRVRCQDGNWQSPARYLNESLGILVSHGICHNCASQLYSGLKINQGDTHSKR